MILSRLKPAGRKKEDEERKKKQLPQLEEFISARDYTGAITLLEFHRDSEHPSAAGVDLDQWLAYCFFHNGDYKRASLEYETLTKRGKNAKSDLWLYLAVCYFYLGMYEESREAAEKGPSKSYLRTRLEFHLAQKFNNEEQLMSHHQQLRDVVEDQLCLASIHFLRSHYQEAIDIYKRILLDNRDQLALNVYVSMCYYKLDYYDVSQEVLAVYLQHFPDSVIAVNLRACNLFKLYNGRAAEQELKSVLDQTNGSDANAARFGSDLLRHNSVIFRGGDAALSVFPDLVDVIPEARLNLVIYYLKQDKLQEAYDLIRNLEPTVPQEYILKGVVNAAVGQETGSRENLKVAQQYFQLVGGSTSECDTIPGRQCMASTFFLMKQFEDVLLYLSSVKTYFAQDDAFNFNYAQSKAALGAYAEAEQTFLTIQDEKICSDYVYLSWLARCYIMNKKARLAWELYLKMETSSESFSLLQVIANDCYKMAQFLYSAKAFDVLERLDPNPEYWEGKRGACVGLFQMIIAEVEPRESLSDIFVLLRSTPNQQVEQIISVMKRWAEENLISI